jgi:hypothetical protein
LETGLWTNSPLDRRHAVARPWESDDMAWRRIRRLLLPPLAFGVIVTLVVDASHRPARGVTPANAAAPPAPAADAELAGDGPGAVAAAVDRLLARRWEEAGLAPARVADDLTVLRRFWLAVAGTIPSLEEIREFEADGRPDRLDHWLDRLLADRRSAEYLARRLATALVGDEDGQFIVFRRDRFTAWLADQIHANRPFDALASEMVCRQGLWTESPAVNFVTQAAANGRIDADKLAGRMSRVMLGQRIDCAQCHDHPFAPYTQAQFEGLAASFAQVKLTPLGVEDDPLRVHRIEGPVAVAPPDDAPPDEDAPAAMARMAGPRNVPPRVPFGAEWLPARGTHRENLAAWLVHPANHHFDRAVVNRAWSIVFGRGWHEPVDDVPSPGAARDPADLLDLLGADFRAHGCDLRRLLGTLGRTRLARLDSTHPALDSPAGCDAVAGAWAAFPLTRLAPAQLIGAMVQATSLRTIDQHSHLLTRTIRFFREIDFVREYGAVQDGQGTAQPATIPQALVRMNGKFARDMVAANAVSAMGRIAGMARDDGARLELVFLAVLTRRPTAAEREALLPLFTAAASRGAGVEDVCWTLLNAPEFCWNH